MESLQVQGKDKALDGKVWNKVRVLHFESSHSREQQLDSLKSSLEKDASAWGVIGALILTVGFSSLLIGRQGFNLDNAYNEEVTSVYVFLWMLSAATSLGAIFSSVFRYIYFSMTPSHKVSESLDAWNMHSSWITQASSLIIISAFSSIFGLVVGVYLLYGWKNWAIALGVLVCVLLVFLKVLIENGKSQNLAWKTNLFV